MTKGQGIQNLKHSLDASQAEKSFQSCHLICLLIHRTELF